MRHVAVTGLILFVLALAALDVALAGDKDIDVRVHVEGGAVRVDASFAVSASPQEVWVVMTDFDHMAEFISNLKSSRVLARTGEVVTVVQTGEAAVGPLKFPFESVREIRLTPFEKMQSRMIGGTLKQFAGETRLLAEASGTRVVYHSDAASNSWIPPLVGPHFIEHETREQLAEFRVEIMKRKLGHIRGDSKESGRSP
jgi:carbon monoxide dehydrogenase subunit G